MLSSDMDSIVISHFAGAAGRRQPLEKIYICEANFTGDVGWVGEEMDSGLVLMLRRENKNHEMLVVLCADRVLHVHSVQLERRERGLKNRK